MGLHWRLQNLMRERKISNKELAQRMGVHRNTVMQLKTDPPIMIRFRHLEALCEALACQPADLFEVIPDHP